MLVRLGEDGVLQGVKDSSGDDVSFRWLCLQNEDAGHPLQVLTGHEVVVDGAYLAVPTARFRVWRTSIRQATWSSGAPRKPATGSACARSRITSHASCTSRAR